MRDNYHHAVAALLVIFLFAGCMPLSLKTDKQAQNAPLPLPSESVVQPIKDTLKPSSKAHSGDEQKRNLPASVDEPENHPIQPEADAAVASINYYHFLAGQMRSKRGDIDHAIQHIRLSIAEDPRSGFLKHELALLHLRQNDTSSALRVIEGHLAEKPDDIDALLLLGKIKQSMRLITQALDAYEKVIAFDPKQEKTYLLTGRLYMERNDRVNAFRIYSRLIEYFPLSYVGHFFIGKIHSGNGDTAAAEASFQKTLELEPALEEPRFELLKIYESRGENEKIVQTYQQLLSNNPRNYKAAMALGYFYHRNGMAEKAEAIFKDLGIRSLEDQDILRKAVKGYYENKQYDAAIAIFEGMLKSAPDSSDLRYVTGLAYDGIKNNEKALMHFERIAPGSRFYKAAVIHSSILLRREEKSTEAIQKLKSAVENVPDDPELFLELGNAYEDKKNYEASVDALKKGLEIDPNNIRLRFRLGAIYDQWGYKDQSIEEMKAVIQLDPKHANALNYLGYTYADLGTNLDEAERLIKEALKYEPESGYITDSLGWVYYKKGLFDEALKVLERAVKMVPDDPIILEHLGDAYHMVNNKEKALEFYHRSLSKLEDGNKDKEKLVEKIRILTESGL